jgi:hypothetical protein
VLKNWQPIVHWGHWRHFKKIIFKNVLATVGNVNEIAIQAVVANIGIVEVFANL